MEISELQIIEEKYEELKKEHRLNVKQLKENAEEILGLNKEKDQLLKKTNQL